MTTFDAYSTYCAHQLARGEPAPTREWWNESLAKARAKPARKLSDIEFDIETERREGWGYDQH